MHHKNQNKVKCNFLHFSKKILAGLATESSSKRQMEGGCRPFALQWDNVTPKGKNVTA